MMHWFTSLVALFVGLVAVVVAEVGWQRAVRSAAAVGLVQRHPSSPPTNHGA